MLSIKDSSSKAVTIGLAYYFTASLYSDLFQL